MSSFADPIRTISPASQGYDSAEVKLRAILSDSSNLNLIDRSLACGGISVARYGDLRFATGFLLQDRGSFRITPLAAPTLLDTVERVGEVKMRIRARTVCPHRYEEANTLIQQLDPSRLETHFEYLIPRFRVPHISGTGWDRWMSDAASSSQASCLKTRRESTMELAMKLYKPARTLLGSFAGKRILFLGCGDGYELKVFLKNYGSTLDGTEIYCIDQSKKALEVTQKIVANAGDQKAKISIRELDFKDLVQLKSTQPFSFAVALGIFDRETLTFEQGVLLARNLRETIAPDCLMGASAYSFELFHRQHYQALGFDILQSGDPSTFFSQKAAQTFYICRNSTRTATALSDEVGQTSKGFWKA